MPKTMLLLLTHSCYVSAQKPGVRMRAVVPQTEKTNGMVLKKCL